jgi:hypothetical protein
MKEAVNFGNHLPHRIVPRFRVEVLVAMEISDTKLLCIKQVTYFGLKFQLSSSQTVIFIIKA